MKTLGGSYLKFFSCKQRAKERVICCSREIGFLGHQKRVRVGFSLAISFQHKYIHSVSVASSAQTNTESEEIQTIYSDQPKTVHVRFKLHKECTFGQQFLVVGDDPIFGLWDPSDGVPLDWSDGHVWTTELDIPSGKVIKYKFILKGDAGNISWQPGPDRILETWDTEKTITVFEDWDNPELQNIVEEELVGDVREDPLINSDLLMVAENLNQSIMDEGTDLIEELANANGDTNHEEKPDESLVAENIIEELGEQDLGSRDKGSDPMSLTDHKKDEIIPGNDSRRVSGSNLLSLKEETGPVSDDDVAVLVPGLSPMPPEENETAELNKVEENNVDVTSIGSAEVEEELTEPELKDEPVSASVHSTEASEVVIDETQQPYGKEQLENSIVESDMQWGRRTLQKFLATLGFQ